MGVTLSSPSFIIFHLIFFNVLSIIYLHNILHLTRIVSQLFLHSSKLNIKLCTGLEVVISFSGGIFWRENDGPDLVGVVGVVVVTDPWVLTGERNRLCCSLVLD